MDYKVLELIYRGWRIHGEPGQARRFLMQSPHYKV